MVYWCQVSSFHHTNPILGGVLKTCVFYFYPENCGDDPSWLIFFKRVEPPDQILNLVVYDSLGWGGGEHYAEISIAVAGRWGESCSADRQGAGFKALHGEHDFPFWGTGIYFVQWLGIKKNQLAARWWFPIVFVFTLLGEMIQIHTGYVQWLFIVPW